MKLNGFAAFFALLLFAERAPAATSQFDATQRFIFYSVVTFTFTFTFILTLTSRP